MQRWILGALALLGMTVGAALAYAPYLPRLLWEGYPKATWPAPGTFAIVPGGAGAELPAGAAVASPDAALEQLFKGSEGRALLVARDGQLVMEQYAVGVARDTRLNSYSLVKSLVAALVLKAIADGRIAGLETPIGDLMTELEGRSIGRLGLCRLLDMRSGVVFEPDGAKDASGFDVKDLEATRLNLLGPMARLHTQGLSAVLDRLVVPGDAEPGGCDAGSYSYQNVNTAIVGAILERVYGEPLEEILAREIWRPSGASEARWRRFGASLSVTPYCCLYARPMDWLRVAQYLIDNGTTDRRFLPESSWRLLMGSDLAPDVLHRGKYTLHAYHNVLDRPEETFHGRFTYFFGSRGQAVYLMPEQRLVVVRMGGKVQLLHSTLYGVARSLGLSRPGASPSGPAFAHP